MPKWKAACQRALERISKLVVPVKFSDRIYFCLYKSDFAKGALVDMYVAPLVLDYNAINDTKN